MTTQNTKSWLASRTIWFNALMVLFDVLINQVELFQPLLSENHYSLLLVFVALVNTYLRLSTKTVIRQVETR